MSIKNSHDKMFKMLMREKKNVIDLLTNVLPNDLLKLIDLNEIEYSDGDFVSENLKESFSDLLVKIKVSGYECKLYFLVEHKSYSYKYSLLQLLSYMLEIWKKEIDETNPEYLTPIIPILVNQSGTSWSLSDNFSCYFNKDIVKLITKYIIDLSYVIYDLNDVPDNDINGNKWFIGGILLMKHIRELKPVLEEILSKLDFDKNPANSVLKSLIVYILNSCSEKEKAYVKKELEKIGGGLYMSIAEDLVQEGKEIGKEIGKKIGEKKGEKKRNIEIAKNLKNDGFSAEIIIKYTGLTIEEIEKL